MKLRRGQIQLIEALASGQTVRDIAETYDIRRSSVDESCKRIRARLGARDNVHMIVIAIARGLIEIPAPPPLPLRPRPTRRRAAGDGFGAAA